MANTSFFPPILSDNIQIPQKIIYADQTETIVSVSDFTSLLDGPGRYIIETSSTSRPTLLSIGLIPVNTYGVLEAIRLDEGEYNYYLNYRGENNKRWFATMIMGICSVWQEVAIKSDLDALSGNLNTNAKLTYDILADAVNVTGTKFFKASGGDYTGTVSNGVFKYGVFLVFKRNSMIFVLAMAENRMALNKYENSTWRGWQEFRSVKTESISGNTDSGGNRQIKSGSYVSIINANFIGYIAIPFHYAGNTYVKILNYSTMQPVASTSVSGTVTYLDE